MIQRLRSEKGKESYALRMYTVEPVFGTLQQHYGLRWINTRGQDLANKVMLMAAAAVNLKKLLKYGFDNSFLSQFEHLMLHNTSDYRFFLSAAQTLRRLSQFFLTFRCTLETRSMHIRSDFLWSSARYT